MFILKSKTKTADGSPYIWSGGLHLHRLFAAGWVWRWRRRPFTSTQHLKAGLVFICVCVFAMVWPLLLSGLWSVLVSLFSRCDAVLASGAGLVLQLFSCFTGDESAMELWLLLSSSNDTDKSVPLSFQSQNIYFCSSAFHHLTTFYHIKNTSKTKKLLKMWVSLVQ